MAVIVPFNGVRYSDKIKNLGQVITPPYDIISSEQQDMFYKRDENNIIRVEYGKEFPEDTENENKYNRAKITLTEWLEKGILKRDEKESFYVYYIDYKTNRGETKVLKGILAAVKLEPFENGNILPHEATFPKHKKDRLELLRACKGNISPIFGIYSDEEDKVMGAFSIDASKPAMDITDDNGNRHRVWQITDPASQKQAALRLADRKLFIADGHHRYETALNYKNEAKNNGSKMSDYILMFIANMCDPGVTILATHRLIRNCLNNGHENLLSLLDGHFNIQKLASSLSINKLTQELEEAGKKAVSFCMITASEVPYLLMLKEKNLKALDVDIFQKYVSEILLTNEQIYDTDSITFIKDPSQLMEEAKADKNCAGFLLNPTHINDLKNTVENGGLMPHKSTYFYPKPATGLVISKH